MTGALPRVPVPISNVLSYAKMPPPEPAKYHEFEYGWSTAVVAYVSMACESVIMVPNSLTVA